MIHKLLSNKDYRALFGYIVYKSRKYACQFIPMIDGDEIISSGLFGIATGLMTFNENLGVNIKTYLRYRIDGEIKDSVRKITKSRSINGNPKFVYNSQLINEILVYDGRCEIYKETLANEIRTLFSVFSSRDKKILELLYSNDLNIREVSKQMNISQSRVSQINDKCINILKEKVKYDTR